MADDTNDNRAITPYIDAESGGDLMWSTAGFEHAQRVAKMFAASALVPEHLRGKTADVTIAILMAKRLREDPLVVMQNMQSIKGKAGWTSQYVIARANMSGVLKGRIGYRETGKPGDDDYAVTAWAVLADTGEEISFEVSMRMAKAEGWTSNPKYKSMPQVMLRYRAATFLVRFHAPDVMLGRSTVEELEDVNYAEVQEVKPARARGKAALLAQHDEPEPQPERERAYIDAEHETVEDAPAKAAPADEPADDESPV